MDKAPTARSGHPVPGWQSRAEFLKTLTLIVGGSAVMAPMGWACSGSGQVEKETFPVLTEDITYPGYTGPMAGHLAAPSGDEPLAAIVVIHENRGLNAHIRDVANRVAAEGFLALAPDALSPVGGTPQDEDEARTRIGQLDPDDTMEDFAAAVQYLKTHPRSTGRVGCVGFCWGGAMANQLAVHSPDMAAAVPYYGRPPESADVPKIKGALLLHYGALDERINAGIPEYEEALKGAGVEYALHIYEGAQHAFNNDTNPGRYHEEAARLAWGRTIAFFRAKLESGSG